MRRLIDARIRMVHTLFLPMIGSLDYLFDTVLRACCQVLRRLSKTLLFGLLCEELLLLLHSLLENLLALSTRLKLLLTELH